MSKTKHDPELLGDVLPRVFEKLANKAAKPRPKPQEPKS